MSTIENIRKRKTYNFFKDVAHLANQGKTKEVLEHIHDFFDENRIYGSERSANFARESLDQLYTDEKL
jgi:hypothetical protein